MHANYRMKSLPFDPEITLALPASMVNDLCARAEENGTCINVELTRRIARTLERDALVEISDEYMGISYSLADAVETHRD